MKIAHLLTVTLTLLCASALFAQTPPNEVEPQVTRVAAFKNGSAFIQAAAVIQKGAGDYRVTEMPAALFGSLWIDAPPALELTRIRAREAEVRHAVYADDIIKTLRAKFGPQTTISPETFLAELQVRQVTRRAVIDFTVESRADAVLDAEPVVQLSYLAQGLAWSPSYRVELIDEEKARIALKAVLVNDLLDLHGAKVELIAGYPNLQFAQSPSAMTLTPLPTLLNSLLNAGSQSHRLTSNAIVMQQRASYARASSGRTAAAIPQGPIIGEGAEDLYFYNLHNVDLAHRERGYFNLFQREVPYEHCYNWQVPDFVNQHDQYSKPNTGQPEIVWHEVGLTNTTGLPWTTGPAMIAKAERFLGQDTLNYTPNDGRTDVRITQTVWLHAQQNEYETAREPAAEVIHGSRYDKVTIRGELSITNYGEKTTNVNVTKTTTGEVLTAEREPKILKLARGIRQANPRSELTWQIAVDPGRDHTQTWNYKYTVLIRR